MALVDLPYPIQLPAAAAILQGDPAISTSSTLSASGNFLAWVGQASRNFTIANVHHLVRALTTNPSQLDVRIETVNSSGQPTGTLWATNTNVLTGNIVAAGWRSEALTAAASITRGQMFAVVLRWVSGNLDAGRVSAGQPLANSMPYVISNGSKSTFNNNRWCMTLSDSGGNYYKTGSLPAISVSQQLFNSGSTTKSFGLRFRVSHAMKICGGALSGLLPVAYNLVLADANGATLATVAMNGNQSFAESGTSGADYVYFASDVTIAPATTYYLLIEPGASTMRLHGIDLASAAVRGAAIGGSEFFGASRNTQGSGAITDMPTNIPFMDLLVSAIDDGASGGGGQVIQWVGGGL